MNDDSAYDLETQAALYALGHLQGEERLAFEEALRKGQGGAAAHLSKFKRVAAALAWGITSTQEPPSELRARLVDRLHQERRSSPYSPGRVALAPGITLVLAEQLAWRPTSVPGVQCKPLFVDPERRYASSLVMMAPGTTYPRHRHAQTEELFMLSGDIRVGGHMLRCGDYCRSEAGTCHETLYTETGCTFIALASLDDELFPEESGSHR